LGKEYLAIVTRIISPDHLMVAPVKTPGKEVGKERKVGLASVRGPKRIKTRPDWMLATFLKLKNSFDLV